MGRFLTDQQLDLIETKIDEVIHRLEILNADLERAERVARAVGSLYVADLIAEIRRKANL